MDPAAGIIGAVVIASWSWGLIRDTGSILLDVYPDRHVSATIRKTVEAKANQVSGGLAPGPPRRYSGR